jgi:hypothetical protein
MTSKRQFSNRLIKILALQRCSRSISLVVSNGLYIPEELPHAGTAEYPYRVELDLACNDIAWQLRRRLGSLAAREWPTIREDIATDLRVNLAKVERER